MRILFAGTPSCAVPALKTLAENFELCGILTNPPAPQGRSKKLIASEVALAAEELKISGTLKGSVPVLTPEKLNAQFREEVLNLKPDLLVCFAYGKIFGPKAMELFPLGGINIHPSLLPRWRGCAPVPAAILAGDKVTGITIQTVAPKADTGAVLAQTELAVEKTDTAETLLSRCAEICCPLLSEVLSDFKNKLKNAKTQNENEALYFSMIKKEDALIDWSEPAEKIERKIRAFTPWPGTFSYKQGEKINIIKAENFTDYSEEDIKGKKAGTILGTDKNSGILVLTGKGVLAVSVLQRQTKNKLFWKDFLNGSPLFLESGFDIN
ncbi:methionyl-tRNA formyltransferase [Treponema pedis]|uniref:methionyl-tRNA formyltransferase n=1 Tax=Treponema pedis TaxID=409322 RepID=UPI0004295514|nr:methionyl-tRNA formyltransferase [Treponema pedis]